jgi:hypothetical protein
MNQTFGHLLSALTCVMGVISVTCTGATSELVPTHAEMTSLKIGVRSQKSQVKRELFSFFRGERQLVVPNLQTEIRHFDSHNAISITEEDAQQLELSLETDAMNQVTSVSQLSDVQPTDWAFQALQLLVERYGIIAGYPDSTFRGNRAMTRYEFAAGLNAALNRINEVVASGKADWVTKDDLITLQKLQEEFAVELAAMQRRVDGLARLKLSEALSFDLGYLAGEANNPNSGTGLFKGDYGAIAQLTFTRGDRFAFGLTYIHSYAGAGVGLDTGTGSLSARLNELGPLKIERPVVGNSYGIEANYQISNNFAIGGWVGYTDARVIGLGEAEIWNYALTLAFPNLGQEGNLGGIIVGMQPKLTATSQGLRAVGQFKDPDTSLHVEGFYRHQLTDNIAVTPGIIWLTAPNHNQNNDDTIIGTIRTTFTF